MLEFKKEYFQTETNRYLYPTTLDISKCEVYGCKDREAFVYKIPNNYYTSNAGSIDFTLYPNGVWSDYTAIKIVEKLPYFQPSINFNKLGDITPSNLNKLKEEIKQHIVDIETAIMESYIFIDSGVPGQNNIPYLPNDCVWFRNGATGNIEALPIGELYDRFQNMIDTLYKEIKDLLLVDKKNMSAELRNETDDLLQELNNLDSEIRKNIENLGNKKIDEIIAEGKKQLGLVQDAGSGLAPRVDDLEKNKLDKGTVSPDYDTAKKIEDKIKGIEEKFKNFCPFPVNSLYLSLGSENPSTLWLGTTWQKQEGRFLLGSSGSYSLGATGGASTVKLAVANLPSHTHSASQSAHTHSQPTHKHGAMGLDSGIATPPFGFYDATNKYVGLSSNDYNNALYNTSANGGDTTGSATPSISIGATGSGTAFSIMPPYLVINIWKRLS